MEEKFHSPLASPTEDLRARNNKNPPCLSRSAFCFVFCRSRRDSALAHEINMKVLKWLRSWDKILVRNIYANAISFQVTGVVGRAEIICSIFFLAAFIFYTKAARRKKSTGKDDGFISREERREFNFFLLHQAGGFCSSRCSPWRPPCCVRSKESRSAASVLSTRSSSFRRWANWKNNFPNFPASSWFLPRFTSTTSGTWYRRLRAVKRRRWLQAGGRARPRDVSSWFVCRPWACCSPASTSWAPSFPSSRGKFSAIKSII